MESQTALKRNFRYSQQKYTIAEKATEMQAELHHLRDQSIYHHTDGTIRLQDPNFSFRTRILAACSADHVTRSTPFQNGICHLFGWRIVPVLNAYVRCGVSSPSRLDSILWRRLGV